MLSALVTVKSATFTAESSLAKQSIGQPKAYLPSFALIGRLRSSV